MEEAILEEVEGIFVGIDLGTTNSVVSYYKNGKFNTVNFKGKKIFPSALYFEKKDKITFGEKALKKGLNTPSQLIKEFKRDLGKPIKYTMEFSSEEKSEKRVFVLDTNIFIQEPLILDSFLDSDEIKLAKTVISELGNLKDRDDVKDAVEMALEDIEKKKSDENISFEESHLELLSEDETKHANDDNDNRVLSIAKYFNAILVTNDKGLKTKAEMNGVGVFDFSEFQGFTSERERKAKGDSITITPKEASRHLLQKLKEESEKYIGEDILKAVITVPANFTPTQISLTKEAGEEAGFDEVAIQKEPIAVGFAYALEEEKDKTILVYDFGGGTFDASILKVGDGKIDVIETDGDGELGGKDITQKLMELIFDKIDDEVELEMYDSKSSGLSEVDYRSNLEQIWREAEKVKVELSDVEDSQVSISNLLKPDGESFNLQFVVTRKEFESEISDIRKKAFNVVANLLSSSGIKKEEIDEIVMAGGTSSIPSIRTSLEDQLGVSTKSSIDTSVVIAQGGAVEAIFRWGGVEPPAPPVIDKALHDFGIGLKNHLFDSIIPKDTPLPVQKTKNYSTEKDNQERIVIRVFQRKSAHRDKKKTYEDGIVYSDEIIVEGIPPSRVGDLKIEVTFELTRDDALSVEVKIYDRDGNLQHHDDLKISKASDA
jgi:molecular chaperone DnaK (HSP70)